MSKTIIYGDLHGCLYKFKTLREKIKPTAADREIVTGDFLDKGPCSNELLTYLQVNNIESIPGNHENKYIRYKKHHVAF